MVFNITLMNCNKLTSHAKQLPCVRARTPIAVRIIVRNDSGIVAPASGIVASASGVVAPASGVVAPAAAEIKFL